MLNKNLKMVKVGGGSSCYSEVNQLMIISDNFCNSNSRNWGGREWGEGKPPYPTPGYIHSTDQYRQITDKMSSLSSRSQRWCGSDSIGGGLRAPTYLRHIQINNLSE